MAEEVNNKFGCENYCENILDSLDHLQLDPLRAESEQRYSAKEPSALH